MKKIILTLCIYVFIIQICHAQFEFPKEITRTHPRLVSPQISTTNILQKIEASADAKLAYTTLKNKTSTYVNQYKTDPEWLSSRFQMYWKSHATDVYVKGEYYSHAKGRAPVPTVRFTGQRDYVTDYKTPSFEDIKPYLEDKRGLFLQHKTTEKWSWVDPSKTGRVIENINERIMGVARDAALIYFVEGDEDYAKFATHIFDVYMQGLYYRKEPVDLEQGNIQNVIGLTSFQVIKENIVDELAQTFDYLNAYLKVNKKENLPIYTGSLKKLAEIIIKNGVPDNNWNLHQANFVIQLALVLDNDKDYEDGKGCQYYLNRVFNETEARQWSVHDVLAYGYDQNGIWNESAGYALSVAKGFTHLGIVIQDALGVDIMKDMPVIPQAVTIMPQYLYPNNSIVAFGDSHYGPLEDEPFIDLIKNAQHFNKRDQEETYTSLLYMLKGKTINDKETKSKDALKDLLYSSKVELDSSIQPAKHEHYMTNSFYAPNVSWVVMRNKIDAQHGLMISQIGSLGNHTHSNGIAMELYGKNYILGPEGGRGSSYFRADYKEYYSQFPAHNTVSVNGKSQYNKMRSYYPFQVNALYPKSEQKTGYYPHINFSDLYFHEPSTDSDQNRVMSIVRTGDTSGYYIDVFRSKTKTGQDDYHDYFYHNLGQELLLSQTNNELLKLESSSKLTSNAGNIKAYDYFSDEESIKTNKTLKATYTINESGDQKAAMNMWVLGNEDREVFKVKSPPSEAFRHGVITEELEKAPLLTTVVRQYGEAWNRPFIAVYEPSTTNEPSTINDIESFNTSRNKSFVGLKIKSLSSRTDIVFSSDISELYTFEDIQFEGTFGLVTTQSDTFTLFIGSGASMEKDGCRIDILGKKSGTATFVYGKQMQLTCDDPILLTIPDTYKKGDVVLNIGLKQLNGSRSNSNGKPVVQFKVPPTLFQEVSVTIK